MAQAQVERNQAAERRAADAGVFALGADAVLAGDPGHQFFGQQTTVGCGLAAAHLPVAFVRVLGQAAVAGVVDADDDERLNFAGLDGFVGVFAHCPSAACDEGSAPVEEVLPVVQVEHRIGLFRVLAVAGRQVDDDVARVGQELASECAMKAQARMEMRCVPAVLVE